MRRHSHKLDQGTRGMVKRAAGAAGPEIVMHPASYQP